jgi:20S proteasome subunit alpha 5
VTILIYARKLLFQLGSTSIGIRTREGVVLAAEKRIQSKLIVPESVEKISQIDDHVGR